MTELPNKELIIALIIIRHTVEGQPDNITHELSCCVVAQVCLNTLQKKKIELEDNIYNPREFRTEIVVL